MQDPLSEILSTMRVTGTATVRFESRGRYAMRFPAFRHLKFGALLQGALELRPANGPALHLRAGDCYLLTDGCPYASRTADLPETDGESFFRRHLDPDGVVRFGEGPPDKITIGGRFTFDEEGAAWLRMALPPAIRIPASAPSAAPLRMTLELLGAEAGSKRLGEGLLMDRLGDILLVQALRAHLADQGAAQPNWLAGLADPALAPALHAFHADVAAPWSVVSLARAAGMSRSSFAERFRARTGQTPMDYVTRWRLFRLRRALLDSDLPFEVLALRNGWQSRSACSRAFRAVFGVSPSETRREAAVAAE